MSFTEDVKATWDIIIDYFRMKNINKVHGMLMSFICALFIGIALYCYKTNATDCFSAPYLACAFIILFAASKYIDVFTATPIDTNDRVDVNHLGFSFVCNYLYIVARAVVYFIMFYIGMIAWVMVLKMHATIDWKNKYTWIIEHTATYWWLLGINYGIVSKTEGDGTVTMLMGKVVNPKMQYMFNMLNPSKCFNPINPQSHKNWYTHFCILCIGVVASVIYGMFGIKAETHVTVSAEEGEANLVSQFIAGFTIVSLIVAIAYMIAFVVFWISNNKD